MTKKNYEEMKSGKVTEVVVPLGKDGNKNDPYSIPLVAMAFHHAPVLSCILKTPTETRAVGPQGKIHTHVSKMVNLLQGSLMEKSGLYTYTCAGNQSNFITDTSQRVILSVSLYIKFVIGE